jgi:Holliday junction resolvase RusA-like endonuclease
VYNDDKQIVKLTAIKKWALVGTIEVSIQTVQDYQE